MRGGAQPGDAFVILEIERHQRRGAASGADRVVEFFEPADGARDRDHVRARLRERKRGGVADAARSAGDERDTAGEGCGYHETA